VEPLYVVWRGGTWWINSCDGVAPVQRDAEALDVWLADRGASRADLEFGGSSALEQKFVHDFGPIRGR
jgi:hypothetical protein